MTSMKSLARLGGLGLIIGLSVAVFSMAEAVALAGTCRGTNTVYDLNKNRWAVMCSTGCPQPVSCLETPLATGLDTTYLCTCDGTIDDGGDDCRPLAYDVWGGGSYHFCMDVLCGGQCVEEYDPDFEVYSCVCP